MQKIKAPHRLDIELEALLAYPAQRERSLAFQGVRVKARVLGWLADENIVGSESFE